MYFSLLFFFMGVEGKDVVDGVLQVLFFISFYCFQWYKFNHNLIPSR